MMVVAETRSGKSSESNEYFLILLGCTHISISSYYLFCTVFIIIYLVYGDVKADRRYR